MQVSMLGLEQLLKCRGDLNSLMGQAVQLPDGHMQAQARGWVQSWWEGGMGHVCPSQWQPSEGIRQLCNCVHNPAHQNEVSQ